jgi:hypothetical protein
MATTEGLTLLTTEIKSGSDWFCSEEGGVQLASVGPEGVEGGGVFIWGRTQLAPRRRHRIIRGTTRYFIFILFIALLF